MSRGRCRAPGSLALSAEQQAVFDANLERVRRAANHLARLFGADRDEALSACLRVSVLVVKQFDPSRGPALTSMLWTALYRAVQRVKREDRTIHIPASFFDGCMREDNADRARRVLGTARLYYDEADELNLPLADPNAPDLEADLIAAEEIAELDRLLSMLSTRSRLVLRARARDIRLETLAEFFGTSRSRIYQIEMEAIATVRYHARRLKGNINT